MTSSCDGLGRGVDDPPLLVARGIADVDREHEAVELGLGQRIGAFLLDRVLRGHDEERRLEVERVRARRDLVFLHGLQERGLGLGGRAVDLVGQDDVGEDRPLHEPEASACRWSWSSSMISVPVMSLGIRSGVNWMRLNFRCSARARVATVKRLGQARHADRQAVAAGEEADQHLLDHLLLADDHLVDLAPEQLAGPLDALDGLLGAGLGGGGCDCVDMPAAPDRATRSPKSPRARRRPWERYTLGIRIDP